MIYNLDLTNKEHQMIDEVLNGSYLPFKDSSVPIYDQLISLIINKKISLDTLQYCMNCYLEQHCYDNCDLVPEVSFVHWNYTPRYTKCNKCNHLLNLDYVIELYKKQRYVSNEICQESKINLTKLQSLL